MSLAPLVAYKLGGSLFSLPDLPDRLRQVWQLRPGTSPLLIVGGGAAADAVREWDRTFQFGPDVAHWLAIDALDLTASLLLRLMPELQLVRSRKQLELAQAEGRPAVLCAVCFVKWLETQPTPLPHSWEVTSDSIAAAAAVAWQAQELVMLKSCDLPESGNLSVLAQQGIVDPYFPLAARDLSRITWGNLRELSLQPLVQK
ncbi:MAG: hypothetical protein V4719_23280 [Planctomycetota bacterium]